MLKKMPLSEVIKTAQAVQADFSNQKEYVDSLNLFPVADNDTGYNIDKTLTGILHDVSVLNHDANPTTILDTIAISALKHSRGNSGTILAKMINGAVSVLLHTDDLSVESLSKALTAAAEQGYEAVRNPKEGTMLTVCSTMAEKARELHEKKEKSIQKAAKAILKAGVSATEESGKKMLEIVKKDQTDAGAFALSIIMQSLFGFSLGTFIGKVFDWAGIDSTTLDPTNPNNHLEWEPNTPTYCTEFLFYPGKTYSLSESTIQRFLAKNGNSELFAKSHDGTFYKVHVHTNEPYRIISFFCRKGEIAEVEIHNMRLQAEDSQRSRAQTASHNKQPKPLGIIVVANGEGMVQNMKDLGADFVVDGGQTANPSAGDILNAIKSVNAESIIILPSNKNIIPAANIARDLAVDKSCHIINTTNVVQSLHALMAYSESTKSTEDVIKHMSDAAFSELLRVVSVTKAYSNYQSKAGLVVEENQFIVVDEDVVRASPTIPGAVMKAIQYLSSSNHAFDSLTIHVGKDLKISDDVLLSIAKVILPGTEVFVEQSGQPIYYVILELLLDR